MLLRLDLSGDFTSKLYIF